MSDAKLVIDGHNYPLPDLGSMTMGEARVLKRYTGKALTEIEEMPISDPDLVAAICHIAILRENPDATFAQVEKQVDKISIATLEYVQAEIEGDARPPDETKDGRNSSAGPSSGQSSNGTSDSLPATTQPPIGAPV